MLFKKDEFIVKLTILYQIKYFITINLKIAFNTINNSIVRDFGNLKAMVLYNIRTLTERKTREKDLFIKNATQVNCVLNNI